MAKQGQAEALWYVAAGQGEWRAENLPAKVEGVRVRSLFSALSRGTESLVFHGKVPASEHQRMRAPFQAGDFPFPVKYGYATVGRVEEGHADLIGRAVFALHPHQTTFDLPADAVMPLPDGLPPMRGVLAANMETALNTIWDSGATAACRINVIGGGVVGLLTAYLAGRLPGADVTLIDILPQRAKLAAALGLRFVLPADAPGDCDVVFHASGVGSGLNTAISCAGDEATVVEMSWYGTGEIPVTLGGAFHSRRLKLIASQVGKVAPNQRARWNYRRRLAAALNLLRDDRLDALLESPIAAADLPAKLPDILKPGGGVLCQPIAYPVS
ncbi:MAG TPA: zinc-binding alcohol dehydrogenase [Alphaproteobacteria bacterium]|jgi:hypothetical protein